MSGLDGAAKPVTPEQYEAACAALRGRLRKRELARQPRAARRDPVIAALLGDASAHLGLLDPERHFRDAIACYPRDAIASFSGKRPASTLPDGVSARYLLAIVRSLHHRHRAEAIIEALIRERLSAAIASWRRSSPNATRSSPPVTAMSVLRPSPWCSRRPSTAAAS